MISPVSSGSLEGVEFANMNPQEEKLVFLVKAAIDALEKGDSSEVASLLQERAVSPITKMQVVDQVVKANNGALLKHMYLKGEILEAPSREVLAQARARGCYRALSFLYEAGFISKEEDAGWISNEVVVPTAKKKLSKDQLFVETKDASHSGT